ncbi:fibronectin type III domain-containing protein, partial [Bacillus sp. REN10]|uniref:fibronectin type III domain-containing protein n=1 Tax=Bacillus sp. REN10 TaxID=2782541 RepID=UPI001EEE666C
TDLRNRGKQQVNSLTKKLLPDAPAGLTAGTPTATSVSLSWEAVTHESGISEYRIYQDGVQVGTSATSSYQVTGLTAETTYNFEVTTVSQGIESNKSVAVSVTTAAA